jgi:hypothetical protein
VRLPEETYVRKSRFDNDDMIELIQGLGRAALGASHLIGGE